MLSDANIVLQPITDTTILDLVRKYPFLGKYYFDDHNISHEWFVNRASITVDILGERFNAEFNVDTEASRDLSIFLHDRYALDYYNRKKETSLKKLLLCDGNLMTCINMLASFLNLLSQYQM